MKIISKMNKEEIIDFFINSDVFEITLALKSDELEVLGLINLGNYVEIDDHTEIINRLCEKGVLTRTLTIKKLDLTFVGETIVDKIIQKINRTIKNKLKIMKELEKFVTLRECPSETLGMLFVDFDPSSPPLEKDPSPAPLVFEKKMTMTKTDSSKVKDLLIEKIIELSSDNDMNEEFSLANALNELKDDELKRVVSAKMKNATNYIATNGRIGQANTILVSKKNYEKLNLSELTEGYELFFDDSVEDIYLYRRNGFDQTGLILATFEDKYELIDIGFFPNRQFQKITLK